MGFFGIFFFFLFFLYIFAQKREFLGFFPGLRIRIHIRIRIGSGFNRVSGCGCKVHVLKCFLAVNFFKILVMKVLDPDPYWIRIRIGIQPKMMDPDLDPDPDEMNVDPQPCFFQFQEYF